MSKLAVSVLIIAQNCADSLRRCLDSLRDFEEIVFVDGGSTDKTLDIAREYPNIVVHENKWPGFVAQRNLSIDKATHPWCFMLDSDEAIAPDTVNYIREVINRPNPKKLYRVVRTEYFEGEAIEQAFGKSDYQERLFQTKHIRYTGGVHHEHLIDGNAIGQDNPEVEDFPHHLRIMHWPYYGMEDWLKKLPRFALLISEEKLKRGKKPSALIVLLTLFGTFFQIYGKSWKQGRVGFVISVNEACYRTLVKLHMYVRSHIRQNQDRVGFEKEYLD